MTPIKQLFAVLLTLALGPQAKAEVFYSEQQIKATLFPSSDLVEHPVTVDRDLLKEIKRATSARLMSKSLKVWEVREQGELTGWLFNAEVLGKHENILYALAVDTSGKITRLEVMEYLETHGGEVAEEHWRSQFYAKALNDPLKLGKDIDNISGATLSCRHLTDGIKGLLIVHDRLLKDNIS